MAPHLRSNTAIDSAVDVVDSIAAALEADPATAELAPLWLSLVGRGDAISADLRAKRRLARRARTRVAVADAAWDPVVKSFARGVLDIAQGRRDAPFYQRFFRSVAASEIVHYGPDREVMVGDAIVRELSGESPRSSLADTWIPRLTPRTEQLRQAAQARRDAVAAIGPLLTAQFLYVEDVNLEIDRLEGALQQIFPGDPARVAAYFAGARRDDAGAPDAAPAEPTPIAS
ncbi:MAG: hypothetical protein U0234_25495 [Sandaracinus sp.]